jgi:hypothetical protein
MVLQVSMNFLNVLFVPIQCTLQSILHQVFSLILFAKWVVIRLHPGILMFFLRHDYRKVCNFVWEFFVGFCSVDLVFTLFSLISYIYSMLFLFIFWQTCCFYLLVFLIFVCFVDSLMTHVWWSIKALLSFLYARHMWLKKIWKKTLLK